jgi:hypothetical protein
MSFAEKEPKIQAVSRNYVITNSGALDEVILVCHFSEDCTR